MRISDWSSDVCSSDLVPAGRKTRLTPADLPDVRSSKSLRKILPPSGPPSLDTARSKPTGASQCVSSEERRVGKECVSPCRSRWSPYKQKKNNKLRHTNHCTYNTPCIRIYQLQH